MRIASPRRPRNMRPPTCPPRRSFVASDARRRGHTWTPPVCKALSLFWRAGEDCRHTSGLQTRERASALMECAGWLLYKSASSKLEVHVRFDQPRSYLSCHQRSIAKATCGGYFLPLADGRRLTRYVVTWRTCPLSYALPEDSSAQARRAFLLAMATAATL